jgi:hypothetical protein
LSVCHAIVSERGVVETWILFCWKGLSLRILANYFGNPEVTGGGVIVTSKGHQRSKMRFCVFSTFPTILRLFWKKNIFLARRVFSRRFVILQHTGIILFLLERCQCANSGKLLPSKSAGIFPPKPADPVFHILETWFFFVGKVSVCVFWETNDMEIGGYFPAPTRRFRILHDRSVILFLLEGSPSEDAGKLIAFESGGIFPPKSNDLSFQVVVSCFTSVFLTSQIRYEVNLSWYILSSRDLINREWPVGYYELCFIFSQCIRAKQNLTKKNNVLWPTVYR